MTVSRAGVACLILLLSCLQPLASDEARTDPAPLHTPSLLTPIETAGSGLEPLVKVELKLNERGIVTSVVVVSVEPSSDYDELYSRAAREQLLKWRFAPATENEKPVSVDLSWSIRFPPRTTNEMGVKRANPVMVFGRDYSRHQVESQAILQLPWAQRKKLLIEESLRAQKFLVPDQSYRAENEYFIVYTDVGDQSIAEMIAQNLASAWIATYNLLRKTLPPQPAQGKVIVFVFRSRQAYQGFVSSRAGLEQTAGFYSPVGLIAFQAEQVASEYVLEVLIHESVHALMDRHIVKPGTYLPRWIGEGFAEYMGLSDIDKGKLVPGGHRKKKTRMRVGQTGLSQQRSSSSTHSRAVKRAVRQGEALSLAELIAADRATFYGESRESYYTQSWLLIHFLRHGEKEWAETAFPVFMLYISEGYEPLEAFEAAYGMPLLEQEQAYRAYIREF